MSNINPGAHCWCGGSTSLDRGRDGVVIQVCNESKYHDPLSTGVPERVTDLYIAGPMTGYPDNNYPAFHEAKQRLEDVGYFVVSPADFGAPDGTRVHYVDLLREDLKEMLRCRGVAILPDWWNSTGARNEVNVAGLLKMPVRPVTEWLERANREFS